MRLRSLAAVAATAASVLLVPLAAPAAAVTTTSTVVVYIADTNDDGLGELWRRPADGSGSPTKIHGSTNDVWLPALSPDGTLVAYLEDLSSVDDYEYRLFVRNTDGTGTPTLLSAGDVLSAPSWSRSGDVVIYSRIDWDAETFGVYHVPATGGAPTLVPTTSAQLSDEPSFAPDPTVVALDAISDEGDYLGIDLVDVTTGKRARVSGTTGGSDPVWSPDGRYILFQKFLPDDRCGVGLYRVPASGGTPVTIREHDGYFLGSAEYSRDGSQIFWSETRRLVCNPGTRAGEIWVANADGTSPQQVTATASVVEYSTSVAGGTPVAADTPAPGAPAIAPVATVSATGVTLSYTPPADDVVTYTVVRQPGGGGAGTEVYEGPAKTAAASGLTTGQTYDFTVYATDSWGNTSVASAVHSARPTPVPVMNPIPRVGTATLDETFTATWTSGAATFDVQAGRKQRTTTGWTSTPAYATVAAGTAEKSQTITGAQGSTYYVRARAHDGLGNVTAYAAPSRAHVAIDDAWSGMQKGGSWAPKTSATRYQGTYHTTITRGSTITMRVDTARFVVIGDKCATCGQVQVWVDGVHRATVDTRASTTMVRQVLYAGTPFSSIKPHTIKLVAVGTSGRPRVSIDAIALQR